MLNGLYFVSQGTRKLSKIRLCCGIFRYLASAFQSSRLGRFQLRSRSPGYRAKIKRALSVCRTARVLVVVQSRATAEYRAGAI